MSSTMSPVEMKTITPKPVTRLKMGDKKSKLVRTSSMEKIKRFNNYICSQHYYIIPALLTWLKSSHSGLQTAAEKTIFIFRSLIFNAFLYSVVKTKNKLMGKMNASKVVYDLFSGTFLLYFTIYLATVLVYSQLLICVYLLSMVAIPSGLYFLLISGVYITFLCHKSCSSKKMLPKKLN